MSLVVIGDHFTAIQWLFDGHFKTKRCERIAHAAGIEVIAW